MFRLKQTGSNNSYFIIRSTFLNRFSGLIIFEFQLEIELQTTSVFYILAFFWGGAGDHDNLIVLITNEHFVLLFR